MLTLFTLFFILLFYRTEALPASPHLEWMAGIQGLTSLLTLLLFGAWLFARKGWRQRRSREASPLVAYLEFPCRPLLTNLLPLLSIASFLPPLLQDSGYVGDLPLLLSSHLLLISLFFDLFLQALRRPKKRGLLQEEAQLSAYRERVDGALEAALKGVATDSLSQARLGLSLLPIAFSGAVKDLEYRALYLFDGLELLALRATERSLLPFVQELLGRVVRLSGTLLGEIPSLATSGLEVAGRIVGALIKRGHLDAAEKSLFTFVQGVRGLGRLPLGLSDFLIRTLLELEKAMEALYRAAPTRPIKLLFVPLAELKRTLQEERFLAHPETLLGQKELDRVIDLFKTLERVLAKGLERGQRRQEGELSAEASPERVGGES